MLFAYPRSQHYGIGQPLIRASGLDPLAEYRIEPLDSEKYQGELTIPGAQLMGQGLKLKLSGDCDSTAIVLWRMPRKDAE